MKHLLMGRGRHCRNCRSSMRILRCGSGGGCGARGGRGRYADLGVGQRGWLQGEVLEEQILYWRKKLAGVETLELATDRPRPAMQSFNGAAQEFMIGAEATEGLRRLCRESGTTLYMTLLAGFQVLLSRYSGQEDIVVGSPIANRTREEVEGLIGF